MTKCDQYQEKLWDYYDGTLSAQEAAEVEKHLESCAACAAEAKVVKQMLESLHTLPEAALPEGYHEELMEKIAKENLGKLSDASIDQGKKQETPAGTVVKFPQKQRKNWKNFGLVAAAVVLVAAAGGIQGIQRLRAPQDAIVQEARNIQDESAFGTEESDIIDNVMPETTTGTSQQTDAQTSNPTVSTETTQTPAQKQLTQTTPIADNAADTTNAPKAVSQPSEQDMPKSAVAEASDEYTAYSSEGSFSVNAVSEDETEASAGTSAAQQPMAARANDIQAPEQITLQVEDVAAALTDIRNVVKEMDLTEKEATETSITVTMKENQKKMFFEELAEIGTLPDGEVQESTAETTVDVTVVCVTQR